MEQNQNTEYYFVTLGRKTGGLLDSLNLPPDATQTEVSEKSAAYIRDLEVDFKNNRKILREKSKIGEITIAEFDEKVKQLDDEKNKKNDYHNKLTADHDKTQAQKRDLGEKGRWLNIPIWIKLSERFPLSETAAPPAFTPPQRSFEPEELTHYAGSQSAAFKNYNEITFSRQIKVLLAADQAWSLLRSASREKWHSALNEWIKDSRFHEPTWSLTAVTPLNFKPEFPRLCSPSDLSISNLTAEAMDDFSELPKRSAAQPAHQVRLEDFLEAMLNKAMREKAAAGGASPSPAKGSSKSQPGRSKTAAKPGTKEPSGDEMGRFLALLELLGQIPDTEEEDK